MKPPAVAASWHISFYSGCRFSRKAHPEAFPGDFGSHKEQTLISSPVTSLGTVNPLDFFSYLRAQWTSSPLRVYPGWPLHLGAWGGGAGGQQERQSQKRHRRNEERSTQILERQTETIRTKGTQSQREQQGRRCERRGERGRGRGMGGLVHPPQPCHRQGREERAGGRRRARRYRQERKEGARQRGAPLALFPLICPKIKTHCWV